MPTPLAGVFADIWLASPPSITIPGNHALTDSGDHQTFQLPYNSPYRAWDRASNFVLQTSPDGTTWSNTAYSSIVYAAGKVTFSAPVSGATPSARTNGVGKYFPLASIGNATEWSAALAAKSVDATFMKGVGGTPWEDYQLTTLGGKFTLKKWWVDETFWTNVTSRTLLILSCLTPTGDHYDAYGYFTDDSIKLAVAGLVEEDMNFTAVDVVSYQ